MSDSDILRSVCRGSREHSLRIFRQIACGGRKYALGSSPNYLLPVAGVARHSLGSYPNARQILVAFGYHLTSRAKPITQTPIKDAPPSLTPVNQWLTSIQFSGNVYAHLMFTVYDRKQTDIHTRFAMQSR